MQGSNEKIWLIKSAGEIKGPYTFEEVALGLQSKEIILVDEVARKFSRWKYIRDEEEFQKIINELKNREDFKNDKTFTDSTTDVLTEDLTDKILSFKSKENLIPNVEENTKKEPPQKPAEEAVKSSSQAQEKPRKFVSEAELKNKSKKGFLIQTALVVAIVCLGAIYYLQNKKGIVSLSYDDLKKQGYAEINYGNFERAKYFLQKAVNLNNNDDELKFFLAYVDSALDDTTDAQKLVNEVKLNDKKPLLQAQAYNLHGIIQLKNFGIDKAKADFEKAIQIAPELHQALFNRGTCAYLENDFEKAKTDFADSLEKGTDGIVFLGLTETYTHSQEFVKDDETKKSYALLMGKIQKFIQSQYTYKQELTIALAYLNFFLGNKDEMNKLIEKALGMDPNLTTDHVLDMAYFRGVVTWDNISDWVKVMRDAQSENLNLKTLYGYAQFKGSEKLKGKETIEGLLQSDYSNMHNQILYGYTLWNLNRDSEAKGALTPILDRGNQPLLFYLMAQICLKLKDLTCAQQNFEKTLNLKNDDLGSIAGLAEIYLQQKDEHKTQQMINQGMGLSSSYRPILAVKEKFEERAQ